MKEKGTKNKTKKMKRKKRKKIYVLANKDGLDYYMDKENFDCGSICAMNAQGSMTGVFFYAEISEQTDKKMKKILKRKREGCITQDAKSIRALKVIRDEALKIRFIIPPGKSGKETLDGIITT
ncbi:MAG: hypothetical protein KKA79_02035 [Nanoarchaeota archaeon]|nr:hypothetical protein [Nanoarchaeota archaeon]